MKNKKSISDCLTDDNVSKETQKRWNLGLMILYSIGIITVPLIVVFSSNNKVGFNIPFVVMIIILCFVEIFYFIRLKGFYKYYKSLKA